MTTRNTEAVDDDKPVRFFHHLRRRFGDLSNYAPAPFRLDGIVWPTTEHFYQAHKFAPGPTHEAVRAAPTPGAAKRLAHANQHSMRSDWAATKLDVMRRALAAKFHQNADVRALLLSTGRRPIVEAAKHDPYWGAGADGTGQNHLGLLLMELREQLSRATADEGAEETDDR